jgi:hypothetical protein
MTIEVNYRKVFGSWIAVNIEDKILPVFGNCTINFGASLHKRKRKEIKAVLRVGSDRRVERVTIKPIYKAN